MTGGPLAARALSTALATALATTLATLAAGLLTACDLGGGDASATDAKNTGEASAEPVPALPTPTGPAVGSLDWALTAPWRLPTDIVRDDALNPRQLVDVLAISPQTHVLDVWPGSGRMLGALGAWVNVGGGRYTTFEPGPMVIGEGPAAALSRSITARIAAHDGFANIARHEWSGDDLRESTAATPPALADVAFTIDDVHVWMALGQAEAMFAALFDRIKPGGILAVIEARAPDQGPQDPSAPDGYVQPRYVTVLAEEAGFVLSASSDVFDNPADTGEHPFGVWSLAPHRRTSALGTPPDPAFDRSALDAIGEPRRMLLVFTKPRSPAEQSESQTP